MSLRSTAYTSPAPAIPDAGLREILKHCSLPTYDAARAFRQTGHARYLRLIVRGILEHQVDRDLLPRLRQSDGELRLIEDLGLDSLDLIEIASVAEDALGFRLESGELRQARTVAELEGILAAKARPGGPLSAPEPQ